MGIHIPIVSAFEDFKSCKMSPVKLITRKNIDFNLTKRFSCILHSELKTFTKLVRNTFKINITKNRVAQSSCFAQATYVKNHIKKKKEIKETEKKLEEKITESCKTLQGSKSTVDRQILGIDMMPTYDELFAKAD